MVKLFTTLSSIDDIELRMELMLMYKKQRNDLISRKMKLILEQQFTLGKLGDYENQLNKIIKNNVVLIKERQADEHNNRYLFITINPKPDIKFPDFRKKVEKLVGRKMFKHAIYAYEQRGAQESEMGKGFHVHILVERNLNYKPFNLKKNTKNTMQKIVGNVNNPALLNMQVVGEDYRKDKIQYFTGIKTGEGKDAKQTIDIVWRKKLGLEDVYTTVQKE